MRVLVFHGYLLRGTGSNVYNANLAAALVRLGHEVHLVCQERHAAELDFVGRVADWDAGELVVTRVGDANCTVYRPAIGGVLPVYVLDRYEGLEARLFPDLSDGDLNVYLDANVRALQELTARVDFDVALANHLVMGPVILARALAGTGVPYAVKVHGSALEYTVKPHPRFLPYAREGIAGANGVLVGSGHVARSLWAALEDDSLPARTRLGPPGVDIASFNPREHGEARARLHTVAKRLGEAAIEPKDEVSAFDRDGAAGAAALAEIADVSESAPLIAFVGKLLPAKGIDLLLAAWPRVLEEVPSARLVVVGFGSYRAGVDRWLEALATADLDGVSELTSQSRLQFVDAFFEHLRSSGTAERYLEAARSMRERVILAGRLEHEELAELLPLCEGMVVPSTFPEAFGMVAVEAAACGVLPISAAHSGLSEVSRALAVRLPGEVSELVSFALGPDAVDAIAERVTRWLRTPREIRSAVRTALVETVRARYSWEGVARGVIAAARGELATLDPPA